MAYCVLHSRQALRNLSAEVEPKLAPPLAIAPPNSHGAAFWFRLFLPRARLTHSLLAPPVAYSVAYFTLSHQIHLRRVLYLSLITFHIGYYSRMCKTCQIGAILSCIYAIPLPRITSIDNNTRHAIITLDKVQALRRTSSPIRLLPRSVVRIPRLISISHSRNKNKPRRSLSASRGYEVGGIAKVVQ